SNDIANAVGPFAAVLDVLRTDSIHGEATVPFAAMLTCGIALVAGLWFIGRKVIATVGTNLTEIHPASGFAAELAAAGIVMAASVSGLPVSSTHILIGAIIGVGLVNRSANWKLRKPIALAWVITLPAAAIIGSIGVLTLRTVLGCSARARRHHPADLLLGHLRVFVLPSPGGHRLPCASLVRMGTLNSSAVTAPCFYIRHRRA